MEPNHLSSQLRDAVQPGITQEDIRTSRHMRYRAIAAQKRADAFSRVAHSRYYEGLLAGAGARHDPAVLKDRRQIEKDLPRTFQGFAGRHVDEATLPPLRRVLTAYVERGRTICAMTTALGVPAAGGAATTARELLTGYPQGLNFLAGMSLLCVGAVSLAGGLPEDSFEEAGFWLLALLLEDVLDPDFFGADVRGNLQMAYIGGIGMRSVIVEHAQSHCSLLYDALGHEVFRGTLTSILDSWILSLYVGCAPMRVLENLWDHLMLPSPYHPDTFRGCSSSSSFQSSDGKRVPRGVATLCAFTLAALRCCGDERLSGTPALSRLVARRKTGTSAEELSLQAGDILRSIRECLQRWPEDEDVHLWDTTTRILLELIDNGQQDLWDEVRVRKQSIVDFSGNYDEQLMELARRTHFTVSEIGLLHEEFRQLPNVATVASNTQRPRLSQRLRLGSGHTVETEEPLTRCDLETFKDVVQRVVPEFPLQLCERLFSKLDAFNVGQLTFVELACGMSALALGSMDEKLQVCFDLFDSEGRRALGLKDLCDLCTTLFRVALAQGLAGAQRASTTEDLDPASRRIPAEVLSPVGKRRQGPDGRRFSPPASTRTAEEQTDDSALNLEGLFRPSGADIRDSGLAAQPWRSMLLRLLAAAQVRTPGGPWLVAFEDFQDAARMEPALLCLFRWCLPRPPQVSGQLFRARFEVEDAQAPEAKRKPLAWLCESICGRFSKLRPRPRRRLNDPPKS